MGFSKDLVDSVTKKPVAPLRSNDDCRALAKQARAAPPRCSVGEGGGVGRGETSFLACSVGEGGGVGRGEASSLACSVGEGGGVGRGEASFLAKWKCLQGWGLVGCSQATGVHVCAWTPNR